MTVGIGDLVRVRLHGRRTTGWVSELDPTDEPVPVARLQPIIEVASRGPAPDLVDLARWASIRWAAGRLRPFLVAAAPPRRVKHLPPSRRVGAAHRRGEVALGPVGEHAAGLLADGGGTLVVPPATSPVEAIVAAAHRGPALVAVPASPRAEAMAAALHRRGFSVAVLPGEWAAAAGGVDVVIGARAAAWAPCAGLAAAVVVDEHDESLQEERAPTWHARDVLIERARRAGAPVLLTSPCPTVAGVAARVAAHASAVPAKGLAPVRLPAAVERAGWPAIDVVDRREEAPWQTSLVSSALIQRLRSADEQVVCVHNTPGRGRVLACRSCQALVRCERCEAALALAEQEPGGERGGLICPRCSTERAAVCQECGGTRFANLRPGVTRIREELEAAAGRSVATVTARSPELASGAPSSGASVFVGTEAVLHRVGRADVVAFLDFDRELLAPRYRAAEQAMALVARAARLVGPRQRGGRILIQTYLPDHEVIRAAQRADPARLLDGERERRSSLQLPPTAALAAITGDGSDDLADRLRRVEDVTVGGSAGDYLVRGPDWWRLGEALVGAKARTRSRARIAVDPPRA